MSYISQKVWQIPYWDCRQRIKDWHLITQIGILSLPYSVSCQCFHIWVIFYEYHMTYSILSDYIIIYNCFHVFLWMIFFLIDRQMPAMYNSILVPIGFNSLNLFYNDLYQVVKTAKLNAFKQVIWTWNVLSQMTRYSVVIGCRNTQTFS